MVVFGRMEDTMILITGVHFLTTIIEAEVIGLMLLELVIVKRALMQHLMPS